MAVSPSTLILSSILSLLLLLLLWPSPSAANEGNIIISGDIINNNDQLSALNANFVIQDDCNLVLYNNANGFQSDTSGRSTNCTLTLSDYGQLIIKGGDGSFVWSSPSPKGRQGEYAAILQPNGQVGIYGPALWSISKLSSQNVIIADTSTEKFENDPSHSNLMFSSYVLNENSTLASRDYTFGIVGCNLELTKASVGVWGTSLNPTGQNCFARLNYHGQISLVSDNYKVLWESKPSPAEGVYVLVMKINGQATIYGPIIWSTAA